MKQLLKKRESIIKGVKQDREKAYGYRGLIKRSGGAFFDYFVWTYDPRRSRGKILPMILYPFQVDVLNWLEERLAGSESGILEKSRDMGISWLTLGWVIQKWLTVPGFSAHVGSRAEYCVDKTGDMDTLFERLRFILRYLPEWLMPIGFNWQKHSSFMRLVNPENNAVITGESANKNFGRQGRATVVLMDEFASWEQDEASWTSVSQTSNCIIVVSTPKGKHNCFARLALKTRMPKKTVHWSDHPHKDQAWYDEKLRSGAMTREQIASELDIDYNASAGRPVYGEFRDHLHTIDPYPLGEQEIIYRAVDFGYHHPACSFWIITGNDDVHKVYELLGEDIRIQDFGLIIKYVCSEELEQHELMKVGKLLKEKHIDGYEDMRDLKKLKAGVYEDFCDTAGNHKSDKSPQSSIEIMDSMGFHFQHRPARIDEGIQVYKKLLATDRVKITRDCPITLDGLRGGYHWHPKQFDVPEKDGYYDHLLDADRYFLQQKFDYVVERVDRPSTTWYDAMLEKGYPESYLNGIMEIRQDQIRPRIEYGAAGY